MMRHIAVCVLIVAGMLGSRSVGFAEPSASRILATLEGDFVSLADSPAGILLLSTHNHLVKIDTTGQIDVIPLPPLDPKDPPGRFSDLVARDATVYLCRFQDPRVYAFDTSKPPAWTYLNLQGDKADLSQFRKISLTGTFLGLEDVEGNVFTVDPAGQAKKTDPRQALFPSAGGKALQIVREGSAEGLLSWKILDATGQPLWTRQGQAPGENVVDLQILGFDPQGRLIVLEVAGNRNGAQIRQIRAIQDGKDVASQPIPGPGGLLPVRPATLLSDGSVGFLHRDPKTGKTNLYKVTL